ncbi:Protein-tyrosine phosphatase [Teladorsagia circumcincta]|uniref:Protein-tyrosine phosphatase n=1 Tax=Teladorsagia circumcincta TaxID=45464 RepID=A0A2G9UKD5_TELCI|nr:Protein-tyrosine phosphatase [Teladorsagia circumcincta]
MDTIKYKRTYSVNESTVVGQAAVSIKCDCAGFAFFGGACLAMFREFPFPFETKVKVMVRQLEVTVPGQPVHICSHYHWMDWPDRGVPEADLAPIALLAKLKENTAPIIVHCSAGIGRTGSIVLIEHAMELLHQPAPLLEIKDYLVELRKQRNNSIQIENYLV